MHTLIATGPGRLEIGDAPIPTVGPRTMLVKTAVSAVSPGSELRGLFEGSRFPRVGGTGYMLAGEVAQVATDVTEFAPGDRLMGTAHEPVGPHCEFVLLIPENAACLPQGMSFVTGACAFWGVPPYRGLLGSGVRFNDDAAVVGLGPLGQCAVQLLRPLTRRLAAFDLVPMRCELALGFGADLAASPADGDAFEAVRALMPHGPAVVVELSGSQAGLELAIRLCAPRGTVVQVGVLPRLNNFELFRPMQDKGVRFVPIHRTADDIKDRVADQNGRFMADVVDMIQRGRLNVDRLATWVAPWTEGPVLIPRLRDARDQAIGVALTW
ncbi:MAG: zinc-binding dehydrogenase [Actinobacteria bacterium]|nr:zinc-binding dehydrogenase [Actinomycetota bacterium]